MFRVILLLACIFAVAYPMNAYAEDKVIKFDYEVHESSPIGVLVNGVLDPKNAQNNKISTFLKLAGQYIPILESLGGVNQDLTWSRTYTIDVAGINLTLYAYFQLIVGWEVNPGGYTDNRFDVVYTPFIWGYTSGRVNGTTFLAYGTVEAHSQYIYAYAPISLQLFSTGKVCFQGSYVVESINLGTTLYAALTACHDEILDDLIHGGKLFQWTCNSTAPLNQTLIDHNFTDYYGGDFIAQSCIEF